MRLFRFDDPTKKPDLSRLNDQSRFGHPRYNGCVFDMVQAEGGGITVRDSSPYGEPGTIEGTIANRGIDGYPFNGTNNYALYPHRPHHHFAGDFTISTIVRVATGAWTVNSGPIRKANNFTLNVVAGSLLRFLIWRSGGTTSTDIALPASGIWWHIIAQFRAGSELRIWIYALETESFTTSSTSTAVAVHSQTTDPLWISRGPSAFLQAEYRTMRLYRRALSVEELRSLREAPYLEYTPKRSWWFMPETLPTIPTFSDFGEYHTVIDGSASGWDQYFENIGAVLKFGSQYFMYYVAGDADADEGDDYVHNRQLGVATSPDGVNWTKYAGNPILSFTPEGDQAEEGIGGCVAVVHDGQVHMYYTALRWRSGGDVDAEVWYCVSDDGLTFTGHTQLVANEGDEFYSCGVYVDSGDTFHVYYVGPLTGGVGDLKRLSGSTPNAVSANGTVSTSDFSSIGGIIDLTASTLLFYNDADPLDGTTTQYLISKSALGTLGPVVQSLDPNPGALLQFSPQFLKDGDQWFYYLTLSASETAPYSNRQIICRAYPARPAFQLSASANIAASAATDTTAILTAPAGKTTGDFEAGKISDDTNPLPSINLTADAYTEVEFCHEPTEYADAGGTYEFRITDNGTPLDTYTEYPEIEIEQGVIEIVGSETIQVALSETLQGFIAGSISESMAVQFTEHVQGYVDGQLVETHSVNPDEAILLTNSLLASDSIAIGLQESTQFENSLEAEESVPVGLSESTQFFNTLSVLDGHAISITEQATLTPFGLLTIDTTESVSINFSEQTIHFNTCSVEELLAILFSEDGSVEIDATGPVSINVTDTISLNPQESVQFYVDFLTAETIQLILLESSEVEETSGLPVQIVASESIGVNLTESVQFLNSLNVSESVSVALLESSSLVLYGLLAVSGSETIPVFVTEQTQFSNTLAAQESIQLAFLETLEGVIIGTVLISASEEIAILVNELASLNTGITLGKIIVSSVVDVNPSFTASSEHPVYTVASLQSLYGAIKTT